MTDNHANFGKLFIVGLCGPSLSPTEAKLLNLLKPSGVVLFKRNFCPGSEWKEKLSALIDSVREATDNSDLLISIDHEGGRVHRLLPPITHFPPATFWGSSAEAVGDAMGKELASLDINLNFAPVVDINLEENNKVIGDRAFSHNPTVVAGNAYDFLNAMQNVGVLGCLKHFPGHGRTIADSHLTLPICEVDLETLRSCELVPYLDSKLLSTAPLIMTAHIMYPQLDPKMPATLSKPILDTLLRRQLGYKGAIISDALEMQALDNISTSDKAVLSIKAGVDILLSAEPQSVSPLEQALNLGKAIQDAYDRGSLPKSCLERAIANTTKLCQQAKALSVSRENSLSSIDFTNHAELARKILGVLNN